jgi:hypothetical protein
MSASMGRVLLAVRRAFETQLDARDSDAVWNVRNLPDKTLGSIMLPK